MKKEFNGKPFNYLDEFYNGEDPDAPNLSSEEIKILWDMAKPKISSDKPVGKLIIVGTKGELK